MQGPDARSFAPQRNMGFSVLMKRSVYRGLFYFPLIEGYSFLEIRPIGQPEPFIII